MREFLWSAWFAKLWEFSVTNYTTPILILSLLYLTLGQLFMFAGQNSNNKKDNAPISQKRFPQVWLFLVPGLLLLFTFKGLVWRHQYWQIPLSAIVAIAAAMGIMLLADILKNINRRLSTAVLVILVGIFVVLSIAGTNYYYSVRWQPLARLKMFEMLNQKIPGDKSLLSYELAGRYYVTQHEAKGGHYRPEIAWYLDRDIEQATSLQEIEAKAATGKFSYYLIPYQQNLNPLINSLRKKYQSTFFRGQEGEVDSKGNFLKAGMRDHLIFNLNKQL